MRAGPSHVDQVACPHLDRRRGAEAAGAEVETMSTRADAIMTDATSLAACARELAIVDHEETDYAAADTHAIMACLVAAADMARESGITQEKLADYLIDLLKVSSALRTQDMN